MFQTTMPYAVYHQHYFNPKTNTMKNRLIGLLILTVSFAGAILMTFLLEWIESIYGVKDSRSSIFGVFGFLYSIVGIGLTIYFITDGMGEGIDKKD